MSIVPGEMLTYTGKFVRPLELHHNDLSTEDIAHALGMICRWGGHPSRFMSVAEHCVLVSRLVPEDLSLAGLLHDASEAYLMDVLTPMKRLPTFATYRAHEARVEGVIEYAYGLKLTEADRVTIKAADILSRRAEYEMLMPGKPPEPLTDHEWTLIYMASEGIGLGRWDPHVAGNRFLARYHELIGRVVPC